MHSEWGRGLAHPKGIFNWRKKGPVKRLEESYTVQGEDLKIPGAGIVMAKGGGFKSWTSEQKFSSKKSEPIPIVTQQHDLQRGC